MLHDMWSNHFEKITVQYDIGFMGLAGLITGVTIIVLTMTSKLCEPNTRGTIFFFGGLMGSLGILLEQGLGGYMYSNVSKVGPFIIGYVGFILFALLTMGLGITGKLKI